MNLSNPKIKQYSNYRWLIFGCLVLLMALITALFWFIERNILAPENRFVYLLLTVVPFLLIAGMSYLAINRVASLYEQREALRNNLLQSQQSAAQLSKRFEAIFQLSRLFGEASEENEVIEAVMRTAVQETKAGGATFVPIDEDGQPHGLILEGEIPENMLKSWTDTFKTPAIRRQCQSCGQLESLTSTCFMLAGPITNSTGIYCLLINRGEREFGVLNLILKENSELTPEIKAFLGVLKHQTSLALEWVRLRRREQAALSQLQLIHQKSDILSTLNNLLLAVIPALEADFAFIKINREVPGVPDSLLVQGMTTEHSEEIISAVMEKHMVLEQPVSREEIKFDFEGDSVIYSTLSAPIFTTNQGIGGVLAVGAARQNAFSSRQLTSMELAAGQVGLVLENHLAMSALEYQAILQERKRLAREIHDGLAQTLGFLKLQAAQIRNFLANEDYSRAKRALDIYYQQLNEAYLDVRQSIDGLRISVSENNFKEIILQMLANFEEISGLPSSIRKYESNYEIAPEIQTQLIRIIQETLSNIRKHAHACSVWIDCFERDDDFWLEIHDDGIGFSPEDVANPSRHGLRGIRERADLIGADFQIISKAGKGTTIRLRYPIKISPQREISP